MSLSEGTARYYRRRGMPIPGPAQPTDLAELVQGAVARAMRDGDPTDIARAAAEAADKAAAAEQSARAAASRAAVQSGTDLFARTHPQPSPDGAAA